MALPQKNAMVVIADHRYRLVSPFLHASRAQTGPAQSPLRGGRHRDLFGRFGEEGIDGFSAPKSVQMFFPLSETMSQPVAPTGRSTSRKGAVTASAPRTSARPRYSVSSNGPMAFTIQSYLIADPRATVLPSSSAHHAQRSPRRNAVTAITLAKNPNSAQ